ncbi:MAG: MazF family transcriptional regulator [Desulfovibrionales bacterium]|nr:MAG: MazF family transcriptional regulator [Desulfovibrionales bacterium]
MVTLVPASVVVIPFPFSDLSGAKLRPAVALTETGYDDWLLCQITSNPYSGASLRLTDAELSRGTLNTVSYARPMKLFTANAGLIVKRVAILKDQTFAQLLTMIIQTLQRTMPKENGSAISHG